MKKNLSIILTIITIILFCTLSASAGFYNAASEYDGLDKSYRNNCVRFARYKVPSLPYGLTYYSAKKNICNSNTAIAGEIAVMSSSKYPEYGHLAYVEAVNGNTITILEGNVLYESGNPRINRRSGTKSELGIYGYYKPNGLSSGSSSSPSTQKSYTAYVKGTDGTLMINSKPKSGNAIGSIPEGAACTVDPNKGSGNWYWVTYNGVSGYSYSKYLTKTKPAAASKPASSSNSQAASTYTAYPKGTDGTLNIRSTPKTGKIVGSIPEGAACTVTPSKNKDGWCYVTYNGVSGYSSGNYLSKSKPSSGGTSSNTRTGVVRGADGYLNINSKPASGNSIGQIPEGASCTVYPDKKSGNWYWVSYNGVSGYAYSKYIILQ